MRNNTRFPRTKRRDNEARKLMKREGSLLIFIESILWLESQGLSYYHLDSISIGGHFSWRALFGNADISDRKFRGIFVYRRRRTTCDKSEFGGSDVTSVYKGAADIGGITSAVARSSERLALYESSRMLDHN